ncbi:Ribose import permease protein RbsC [Baekduia alba]|uniref:ABC transporter permease n=1 Tax=Baekduia alba TaxID=2997333 RepID=UPI0023424FF4|nr:ABC transporter permease [Baekduia alba]WCB93298.1 Ribose import permease protein RbsC [Baekduia alba]
MPDLRELLRTRPFVFAAALALVLLVANILAEPSFGKPGNWPTELATLVPFAIVAMASTPAIVSGGGGLDISVGPIAVLANVVLVEWLLPGSVWVDLPLLMVMGLAIGALNGALVTLLRYQPVIATLCTFFVLAGVIAKIAPSNASTPAANWTADFADKVGPIPGALILLAIPLAIWFALSRTAFHRNLYAVGGNDATAFSAGIDVTRTRIAAYALGGCFAAVAGVALTALVQSTQATGYSQYTLIALAAVALGGTQLGGGRGGLIPSLLGACCIYLMQTLLGAVGVSSSWLTFVYGALLVTGVVIGAQMLTLKPRSAQA